MYEAGAARYRRMDRRDFIRISGAGVLGLGLADRVLGGGEESPVVPKLPKAKSVIAVSVFGGIPNTETFDPKPKRKKAIVQYKIIPTNVPGIEVTEMVPMLAKIADKYSILRTVTGFTTAGHDEPMQAFLCNAPEPVLITSSHPSGRIKYPAVSTIVGMKKRLDGSYQGELPACIHIIGQMRGEAGEGFLGPKWKPYYVSVPPAPKPRSVAKAGTGDANPEAQRLADDARRLAEAQRLAYRQQLRKRLALSAALEGDSPKEEQCEVARTASSFRQEVFKGLEGLSDTQKVLDLSAEPEALKDRYGRHQAGQACLLARRFVQCGVPFVKVAWGPDHWDVHGDHDAFYRKNLPIFDQTISALIEDLSEKGLLESTIVVVFSEHGRSHDGLGKSVLLAGGGFKGGKAIGEMDDESEFVKSRPIYPWDLWESIYLQLGIDPHDRLPSPTGCPVYVSQADAAGLPRGGILKEIM